MSTWLRGPRSRSAMIGSSRRTVQKRLPPQSTSFQSKSGSGMDLDHVGDRVEPLADVNQIVLAHVVGTVLEVGALRLGDVDQ